jgi:hypothetical protein
MSSMTLMSQNLDGNTWNSPYNDTDLGASHWFINYRDSIMVPSTSAIFFATSVIQYVLLTILLLWRREMQPVKSRGAFLLFSSLTGETFVIINNSARYMVGWWKYPCFLYVLTYSVVIPFIFLPGVLRAWRLMYIYRLNSMKKLFSTSKKYGSQISSGFLGLRRSKPSEKVALPKRTFALWNFWVSSKFIAISFLVAFLIHIGFFVVNLFLSGNPILFLSFKQSCEVNNPVAYFGVAQALAYIAVNLILIVLIFIFKVKDTWSIRNEASFVLLQWIFFFTLFLVFAAFFYDFYIQGQRYWPYGYFIILACFIDLFCTCWIPIIRSFTIKRAESSENGVVKTGETDSDLLLVVLKHDDFRALFRNYCERSFCPEMVLFWEDVQEFMKLKTDAERRTAAKKIISRYLETSSPLELNLPSKQTLVAPIIHILEKYEIELARNAIPVGTSLLAEIGTNIAIHVFGQKRGSKYSQAFINQLSKVQTTEDQSTAATSNESVGSNRSDSFQTGEVIELTNCDDTLETDTNSTESNTNTEVIKKSKSNQLLEKLRRKAKNQEIMSQKQFIPSNLFDELIFHDRINMLDVIARFKNTKEFKKFMEEMESQENLELVVF